MSRTAATLTVLAALAASLAVAVAGATDPPPVGPTIGVVPTVTLLATCQGEYGGDATQEYPCVWDARGQGNGTYNGDRYLVYYRIPEGCPVNQRDVRCVPVGD